MEGERDRKSPDQNLTLRITGIQQSAYEALQHKCIRKGKIGRDRCRCGIRLGTNAVC